MSTFIYVLKYKDAYSVSDNIGAYSTAEKANAEADRLCESMPRAWKRHNFEIEALTLE